MPEAGYTVLFENLLNHENIKIELGVDAKVVLTFDFEKLEEADFDAPLGESTGAGVIFGTTGGVMEAALRTAYEKATGKILENVDFEAVRGFEGLRTATISLGETRLNVAVVHGLSHARKIMEEVKAGNPRNFHAIEVMACPGGCIAGAGTNIALAQAQKNVAAFQKDAKQQLPPQNILG